MKLDVVMVVELDASSRLVRTWGRKSSRMLEQSARTDMFLERDLSKYSSLFVFAFDPCISMDS